MLLEALHNYSILAYIVKRDGLLTKIQNIVVGWVGSAAIILIICSLCYEDYGGRYHCWIDVDTKLIFGQLIPIVILWVITLTLIEAAGAENFKKLSGRGQEEYLSGKSKWFPV